MADLDDYMQDIEIAESDVDNDNLEDDDDDDDKDSWLAKRSVWGFTISWVVGRPKSPA